MPAVAHADGYRRGRDLRIVVGRFARDRVDRIMPRVDRARLQHQVLGPRRLAVHLAQHVFDGFVFNRGIRIESPRADDISFTHSRVPGSWWLCRERVASRPARQFVRSRMRRRSRPRCCRRKRTHGSARSEPSLAGRSRYAIDSAFRIGSVAIDRGRQVAVADGQHRCDDPQGAGSPHRVAQHRLDRTGRGRAVSEHRLDGRCFVHVIHLRAGPVGADIVDLVRGDPRVAMGAPDASGNAFRVGRSRMLGVAAQSIALDLGVNAGARASA